MNGVRCRRRDRDSGTNGAAAAFGCSLHAGIGTAGAEREKLEHLCRYVSRPAVATGRLALSAQGQHAEDAVPGGDHARRASIEDAELIERILAHRAAPPQESLPFAARAPPPRLL